MPNKLSAIPTLKDIHKRWPERRYQRGMHLLRQNKREEAMPCLLDAANNNVAAAQYKLGMLYELHHNMYNPTQAFQHYQAAANNHHDEALYACARMIIQQSIKPKHVTTAFLLNIAQSLYNNESMTGPRKQKYIEALIRMTISRAQKENQCDVKKQTFLLFTSLKLDNMDGCAQDISSHTLVTVGDVMENSVEYPDHKQAAMRMYLMSLANAKKNHDAFHKTQALMYLNQMAINKKIQYAALDLHTIFAVISLYKLQFIYMSKPARKWCDNTLWSSAMSKIFTLQTKKESLLALYSLVTLFNHKNHEACLIEEVKISNITQAINDLTNMDHKRDASALLNAL
jgi:TPR repeat protein